jgi:biopolymer transport protein ExbD
MDEDRHKILVILVFFMATSHFYHSQTSIKAQQEEKRKMRLDEMKKEKIWNVWFRVNFDQQGGFHQNKQYCIATTLPPRVANWELVSQLDKYPCALGPNKGP